MCFNVWGDNNHIRTDYCLSRGQEQDTSFGCELGKMITHVLFFDALGMLGRSGQLEERYESAPRLLIDGCHYPLTCGVAGPTSGVEPAKCLFTFSYVCFGNDSIHTI